MPFPRFADGDVEIRFTEKDEPWVLHSYVLGLHSEWFKAALSPRWDQGSAGTATRRTYELRFEGATESGTLIRASVAGQTEKLSTLEDPSHVDLTAPTATVTKRISSAKAHQAMLGALYHVPPTFGNTWNASIMNFIELVASTADYYGCAALVRVHIHNYLRQKNNQVLSNCQTQPLRMMEVGVVVRADWIVKECAAIIICKPGKSWTQFCNKQKKNIGGLESTLAAKRAVFEHRLRDIGFRLLHIDHISPSPNRQPAVDMFRQWLIDNSQGQKPSYPEPGYGAMYRQLGRGKPPHEITPMLLRKHGGAVVDRSLNSTDQVVRDINLVWNMIFKRTKDLVVPLLEDVLEWAAQPEERDDLRFMTIEDCELPWSITS